MNSDEALHELATAHPLDLSTAAIAEVITQQAARIAELKASKAAADDMFRSLGGEIYELNAKLAALKAQQAARIAELESHIRTDNTETLANALARIKELESQQAASVGVKRYNMDVDKFGQIRPYQSEHGQWVKRDDYDACASRLHEVAEVCAIAEQERDALRAQVEVMRELLRKVAPHFAAPPGFGYLHAELDAALAASKGGDHAEG